MPKDGMSAANQVICGIVQERDSTPCLDWLRTYCQLDPTFLKRSLVSVEVEQAGLLVGTESAHDTTVERGTGGIPTLPS